MPKRRRPQRRGIFGWSAEASRRGVPLLAAGFLGAWLTRFFQNQDNQSGKPESLQDELLIAVSSASPVALPDAPADLFEQKTRFTIAINDARDHSVAYASPDEGLIQPPSADLAVTAEEDEDDDEGIFWWDRGGSSADPNGYLTDIAPHPSSPAPANPAKALADAPADNVISETELPQSQEKAGTQYRPESLPDDEGLSQLPEMEDERFVSITQLNQQMGPPAPEEDDDDDAGWLWWGDGVLAWFATATAGLLGGTGSGAAAALAGADKEAVVSGLEIAFAAGPFLDGELALKAVDANGNPLFTYNGESVGSVLANGVTLTGVSTETVLGESVITGLDVQFEDFSGQVFLQVDQGSQYIDEALSIEAASAAEARTPLDTPLRAVAEVPPGDVGFVNLSPFTELAIRIIQQAKGVEVDLDTPDPAVLIDAQGLFDSAAERVAEIVGVDIRTTRPVAVNQESFAESAQTDSSQYGLKLAALSQLGQDQGLSVAATLDRLIDAVEPTADDVARVVNFSNPTKSLQNRVLLTDSQDTFVLADDRVPDLVIDAIRPAFAPVIDPVVVVEAGSVTINGTAFFFDTDNSTGDPSELSVFMALGDSTLFTVDGVEGSGSGALGVSGGQPLDDGSIPSGDWSLRIDNLDQGVYTFDAYVVDEGANVTRSAPASGDTTPSLVLVGGESGVNDATELEITLTEGDTAADITANDSLITVDLGSGDAVTIDNLAVSSSNNPLSFSDEELLGLISIADGNGESISLVDGTLLDSASNLASLEWSFAGEAAVFDTLASGDIFSVSYTLQGIDTDANLSNNAVLEVTVTGTNDAPVNTVSAATGDEDTAISLTGLAVADVDETGDITVTLSVQNGRIDIADDVSGGLTASDISGDGSGRLTLTGSIAEINATLNAAGALSYQGESEFSGTDTLTMRTTDSVGDTTVDETTITVSAVNDPPTFPNLLVGEVADGPLIGDQDFETTNLSGDFSLQASDPDADGELTFSQAGDGVGLFGSLSLEADGRYQYTPDITAVEALGFGESGSDSYLITVTDPLGDTASGFYTVNVTGANDTPTVAAALTSAVTEDGADASIDLLSGASDLDSNDTLSVTGITYTVDGSPTGNSGSDVPTGLSLSGDTVTVDASAFQGLGSGDTQEIVVAYDIQDDSGQANDSVAQTATITVTGINDAPTLNALTGGSITDGSGAGSGDFTTSNLTGSFAASGDDVDIGDTLAFSVSGSGNGTFGDLVLSGDGSYGYQMDVAAIDGLGAGESDSDSFTIAVSDGSGEVATQTFTVDVTGVNDAPIVEGALTAAVREDGSDAEIDLFQGASDRDSNDQLSVTGLVYRVDGVLTASGGTAVPDGLSVSGDRVLVDADAAIFQALGSGDQQVITVDCDIKDDSGEANDTVAQSLTITINGVDDPPRFDGPLPTGSISEDPDASTRTSSGLSGDFSSLVTVVDSGDTVDFSVSGDIFAGVGNYGELLLQTDGSYLFFPDTAVIEALSSGDGDSDTFTIIATSSNGEQSTATYTVNVFGANDLPTLSALTAGSIADGTGVGSGDFTTSNLTGSFAASGDDVDIADTLTFSVSGSSSGTFGDLTVSGDGAYTYAVNESAVDALSAGESGSDTFTIEVDDGNGGAATQSFNVDVTGANEPPSSGDATAPRVTLDPAKHIFKPGDVISEIAVNFTAPVTGLAATDFDINDGSPGVDVFQTMVFDDTGADQILSIRPLGADPGLASSTFVTIQLLANTVADAAGNGNTASNTERLVVLGDDAISGDVRDEIMDADFKRADESERLTGEGEFVFGDAGDDILLGFGGDDILMGAQDDDVLIGGEGVDTFLAGPGDDYMAGGSGDDVYLLDEFGREMGAENIFIGNDGEDRVELTGAASEYLINRVSDAQIAQINELLQDDSGNFRGLSLPDLQIDTTLPVLRVDYVTDQGRQTDFVQSEILKFTDITLVYAEITSYHDSNGDGSGDLLPFLTVESASDAFVHNGGGRPVQETTANYLLGKDADDRLIGGLGDDDIRGGAGNDVLASMGGKGLLDGGSGDDVLVGFGLGSGDATELTGAAGADTFVIAPQEGVSAGVTIKDFSLDDGDLINIDGLLKNLSGEAASSVEVFNSLQNIDYLNDAAEIDLSGFFVAETDSDTPAEYTAAEGVLRIEFATDVQNGSFDNGTITATDLFTDSNPVGSTAWWQDLMNDGGLA